MNGFIKKLFGTLLQKPWEKEQYSKEIVINFVNNYPIASDPKWIGKRIEKIIKKNTSWIVFLGGGEELRRRRVESWTPIKH